MSRRSQTRPRAVPIYSNNRKFRPSDAFLGRSYSLEGLVGYCNGEGIEFAMDSARVTKILPTEEEIEESLSRMNGRVYRDQYDAFSHDGHTQIHVSFLIPVENRIPLTEDTIAVMASMQAHLGNVTYKPCGAMIVPRSTQFSKIARASNSIYQFVWGDEVPEDDEAFDAWSKHYVYHTMEQKNSGFECSFFVHDTPAAHSKFTMHLCAVLFSFTPEAISRVMGL